MWNPKRVLLLGLGFAVFLAGYVVYAQFLGGIDGLPPLPEPLKPGPYIEIPFKEGGDSEVDRKLKMAYGPDSPDLSRTIKFEIRKRGMVIACDASEIVDDGKVRLTPMRLALFSEDKGDGTYPEINTIRSDTALLTFDQKIENLTDIGQRKVVGAELKGNVTITNNRRTSTFNDDLVVLVDDQALYFDENLHKVWTSGHVKLLDNQTRPHPTTISGRGLEMYLTKDEPEPRPGKKSRAPARPKGEGGVNGVERVLLLATVEMHLFPDNSNSGFPGAKQRPPAPAAAQAGKAAPGPKSGKPEQSRVVIRTPGPFDYDVRKDLAVFEAPAPGPGGEEHVHVIRQPLLDKRAEEKDGVMLDQLYCDRLELQFRRKNGAAPAAGSRDTRGGDREIESAHATARPGGEVHLVMDTEELVAECLDLLYSSATPQRGAQTVLKGTPMHAIKEGHKIEAQELLLLGADRDGNGQRIEGKGPGQVDLFDRNNPTKTHPIHARWNDMLVSTKDKEGDRTFDLLTFTGDAVFIDDEHDQELRGEKLQVWLEPNDRPAESAPKSQDAAAPAENGQKQRPHKLEAFERVKARSPEMKIHECLHLWILFEDRATTLPEPVVVEAPAAPAHPVEKGPEAGDSTPLPTPGAGPAPANGPPAPPPAGQGTAAPRPASAKEKEKEKDKEKEPKKPIELWARDVKAYVNRVGQKNDLRELVCEGTVHVHQDGSKPDDKGVDIKGELLQLEHHATGDILTVYGDQHNPAELQLGDVFLVGPKVKIDQQKNVTWVVGIGAMTMPSNTTFEGAKSTKPGTLLTVHWTKDMLFNGKDADFHGGVVSYQDNGSLKCQTLQVTLDKVVSFKEGQKGGQGAKVEKLVAHGKVYVVDSKHEERTGELTQYQRLLAHQLAADNLDARTIATGPGTVYLLQKGSDDPLDTKPAQPAAKSAQPAAKPKAPAAKKADEKKADEEMKLTRIDFEDRMFSNEKGNARTSKFYKNVEVLHLPAKNPDVQVDLENLPKGAMYMRCDLLTVYSKPLPDGRKTQEMLGERKIFFRTPEFYGRSDRVKYNEAKDQVIFEGNPATLYRQKLSQKGREYDVITGGTILYNRKQGTFILDRGDVININQ